MHPDALEQIKQREELRLHVESRAHRQKPSPTFLPVELGGGIGDAILSRLTLNELLCRGHHLGVWSVHAAAVNYFGFLSEVNHGKIPEFTWHLKLDPLPRFIFSDDFSGFVIPSHQALFDEYTKWMESSGVFGHMVRVHSDQKWLLADHASAAGFNTETLPAFVLGMGKQLPETPRLRSGPGEYITIHDGFDAQNPLMVSGRSTKQWDWRHWNETVRTLKKEYPNLVIKQLGTKLGRPIDGVDELLLGKTTITEAFDILSMSRLHIDTDSGLAHAATKLGVPCVVLFGPTPKDFYGHAQNTNLSSQKSCSGNCFWLTKNWMDRCPIGHPAPVCMDDISVESVIAAARSRLQASPAASPCA